jgi:hypothetical protein
MKALFVLAALALAGCGEVKSPTSVAQNRLTPRGAAGDMLVNETTPVDLGFVACNGELVPLSGNVQYKYEITTPASGSFHARITSDYTFSGFGSVTGAKYEGGARFVDKENYNSGAATVFNVEMSVHMIGQGSVPNSWLDGTTAFTINANGDMTHNAGTYTTRCQ